MLSAMNQIVFLQISYTEALILNVMALQIGHLV